VWGPFGTASEWRPLRRVLLHGPGPELEGLGEPGAVQFLARPDPRAARREHEALAAAYRAVGVEVAFVAPERPTPNLMFVADLLFMTPSGAILARPASTVRAGEEVEVQRALAALRIPILGAVHGRGVFEGADALWLDRETVLLATGLRTNDEGAAQVGRLLSGIGVTVLRVRLGEGTMHLMGTVRILDRDLALVRAATVPPRVERVLEARGFEVLRAADEAEAGNRHGMNVVALGPRRIVMPAGCPRTRSLLEGAGVRCVEVEIGEIAKAAGGIACMTGILSREG